MEWIREEKGGVVLLVHAQPGAKVTEISGLHGGTGILGATGGSGTPVRLKIRVHAPPVDGKANEELIRFFSKTLGVSKSQVEILRGEKGRQKEIRILGISSEKVRSLVE